MTTPCYRDCLQIRPRIMAKDGGVVLACMWKLAAVPAQPQSPSSSLLLEVRPTAAGGRVQGRADVQEWVRWRSKMGAVIGSAQVIQTNAIWTRLGEQEGREGGESRCGESSSYRFSLRVSALAVATHGCRVKTQYYHYIILLLSVK